MFEDSARANFCKLKIAKEDIKSNIFSDPEFVAYTQKVKEVFTLWATKNIPICKAVTTETKPKRFIHLLSEDLLDAFSNLQLIDKYDVYQHLMTYWIETMQDDCAHLITTDGWKAGNEVEWIKKDFEGKLIPKGLLIKRYFAAEQQAIEQLEVARDVVAAQMEELEEEHGGEEGLFSVMDKVNKANAQKRLRISMMFDEDDSNEKDVLTTYIKLADQLTEGNRKVKEAKTGLDANLLKKYAALTDEEIKQCVVEDKWIATIETTVNNEMQCISHRLAGRIKELAERYESTLPQLTAEVGQWEEK